MILALLLCATLMASAQPTLWTDKPCDPQCSRAESYARWLGSPLDAESLHTYDQIGLNLVLHVEDGDLPMEAGAGLTLVAREELSEIPLNAEGLNITAVRRDGQDATYTYANDTLIVHGSYSAGDTIFIAVDYSVAPRTNWFDTGFQTGWEHCYTFSEPFGARRWYPCWDQPYDKFSTTRVGVLMPENWSLASNGQLVAEYYVEPDLIYQQYENYEPIASYLVCFAAGNFSREYVQENAVEYRYFAWPRSDSAQASFDFARTPEMVTYFSGTFGDYPFDQYGMVMTDIFGGWGAMEHQTFTTYGFNLVDSLRSFEGIVAHELAHQWFGDHLSPVDFRNMWLNEGFATYGSALWAEHLDGETGLNASMAGAARRCYDEENLNPPSYAVYDPPADRIFGDNVYFKGAWVLHMLRKQLLGDSLFFAVMRDYVETFGAGNVSTDDFINVINEHYAGPDVNWFFEQWVYGLGYPIIEVPGISVDTINSQLNVVVQQDNRFGHFYRFPLLLRWLTDTGTVTDSIWIDATQQTTRTITAPGIWSFQWPEYQITLFESPEVSSPEQPQTVAADFAMSDAFPNPFNPSITIPLTLTKPAAVELKLFDLIGREVAIVHDGPVPAGIHALYYEAPASVAAGVYFLRAQSGKIIQTQKILLLK